MALYGDIFASGQKVYSWEAVRRDSLIDETQVSTYACEVVWWKPGVDLPLERLKFEVRHKYDDGAAALAAKVLARAVKLQQ